MFLTPRQQRIPRGIPALGLLALTGCPWIPWTTHDGRLDDLEAPAELDSATTDSNATDTDDSEDTGDTAPPADRDGDGTPDDSDCAPDDDAIHPGAAETCDGIDNDCDGDVDEGSVATWYPDADGDGYGDDATPLESACEKPPSGHLAKGGDCDDADAGVFPGAFEICDGKRTDCDDDTWTTDDGRVSFQHRKGEWVDLTKRFASGGPYAPTELTLKDSGTLRFCDGTYYAALVVTAAEIAITSQAGAGSTTLSAEGESRVIGTSGTVVTVEGLTLANGAAGTGWGGAISADGTTLTVTDCVFIDNGARNGGAIYLTEVAGAQVSGCSFEGNEAELYGGALYMQASSLVLSDSSFQDNSSTYDGGALLLTSQASAAVTDTSFHDNESDNGGAVWAEAASSLSMQGSSVTSNSASIGAGLGTDSASLDITSSSFSGNAASNTGGGVSVDQTSASFEDCNFEGNSARAGGGLALTQAGSASLDGCIVSGNTATDHGGGMYLLNAEAEVTSSDWEANKPDDVFVYDADQSYDYGTEADFDCGSGGCTPKGG